MRQVEGRGAIDTTRRTSQYLNNIFIYAVACGYCENNPAGNLVKALKVSVQKNMPAITEPDQIKELLNAIDGLQGSLTVKLALRSARLYPSRQTCKYHRINHRFQ